MYYQYSKYHNPDQQVLWTDNEDTVACNEDKEFLENMRTLRTFYVGKSDKKLKRRQNASRYEKKEKRNCSILKMLGLKP